MMWSEAGMEAGPSAAYFAPDAPRKSRILGAIERGRRELELAVGVGDARDGQTVDVHDRGVEIDLIADLRCVFPLEGHGEHPVASGTLPHEVLEQLRVEPEDGEALPVVVCLVKQELAARELHDAAEGVVGSFGTPRKSAKPCETVLPR